MVCRGARTYASIVLALAVVTALLAACSEKHSAATRPTTSDESCSSVTTCSERVRGAVGKTVLSPTKATLAFVDGWASPSRRTVPGEGIEALHLRDEANGRLFRVNVFLDGNLHCTSQAALRQVQSPGGHTVCFLPNAGIGVDIRYAHDGLTYVFSFVDPKDKGRNNPTSEVGRWALSVVDSYA